MKKKLLALGLACAMGLSLLAGCGGETTPSQSAGDNSASPSGQTGSGGSVYYLNFKPEQDAQWQELAEYYTQETGVPVKVVTAASNTMRPCSPVRWPRAKRPPCSRSTALWV